jgi:hypothetical protein
MFIPDPNFYIPDSGYLDPGSASKNLIIFTPKNFSSSGKYDPRCSSRFRIKFHHGSRFRIQRPKKHRIQDLGSATLIGTVLHREEPVPGVGPPYHLLSVEGADEHRLLLQ